MSLFDEAIEDDFDDFDDLENQVKPQQALPSLSNNPTPSLPKWTSFNSQSKGLSTSESRTSSHFPAIQWPVRTQLCPQE